MQGIYGARSGEITVVLPSPISRLYLPYISPISPLYLAYISPISPVYLPYQVAVRMSMGVPGIMEPLRYQGHVYCDGGMTNDFPMNALPEGPGRLGLMVRARVTGLG